jgi:hypothetical protein
MIRRSATLLVVAALAGPVSAAQPLNLDQWAGVYKVQFGNGTVDGGKYTSENILEIVKVSPNTAYVRAHLEFYNGHLCSIWGIADVVGDRLVYRATADNNLIDREKPCVMSIVRDKDRLVIHDNFTCKPLNCGMRGSFEGERFPMNARRPIRYMDRLKASREFSQALAERRETR